MTQEWANWSGSLRFTPGRIVEPASEEALTDVVRQAANAGQTVRVVGAGHSSSPLVETSDVLVSLAKFRTVEPYDEARCEAVVGAGVTIEDANAELLQLGMALANLGDVDYQTVAGAIGTGTHGTGVDLPNLATHLVGGRMVTGTGEIVSFAEEDDPAFIRSMRVSLGASGILTTLRLRLVPAYRLRRSIWCTQIDDCLDHFAELAAAHRIVDFYWYPRSDEAKIRIADLLDDEPADLPYARFLSEQTGWIGEVIPKSRELRFEEMEYGVPAEQGLACFREVRERIKARWRQIVGWRVLYRTIAADDAHLSIAYDRPTVTISLHQNATLPYQEFFADIERIFLAYGGRPHWGKKHSLRADELQPLFPAWDHYLADRQRVDPGGVFLNPYLRDLLGIHGHAEFDSRGKVR
jgi:FAD/FMN-containing dehydrogenase